VLDDAVVLVRARVEDPGRVEQEGAAGGLEEPARGTGEGAEGAG